jgi:hypothetical protein
LSNRIRQFINAALAAGAALAVIATPGCGPKKSVEVWEPKPLVAWRNVALDGVPAPADGYVILAPPPTKGLFPANVAVTRIATLCAADAPADSAATQLYADPRNEFLRWNSVFDDQMAVSEVFPVQQRNLAGGPADPAQVLAASRGLEADMSLIYAVNELAANETEMFGVLYETTTTRPLAAIHARATSVLCSDECPDADDPCHAWETDSRVLVRDRFAALAHDCMRELILHDEPISVPAPEGWIPEHPPYPVQWPPPARQPLRQP